MAGSLQWLASCCCWRTSKCWVAWHPVSVARQSALARWDSRSSWCINAFAWCLTVVVHHVSNFGCCIGPGGRSFSLQCCCQWGLLSRDPQQSAPLPQPAGWCAPHALWGQMALFLKNLVYVDCLLAAFSKSCKPKSHAESHLMLHLLYIYIYVI